MYSEKSLIADMSNINESKRPSFFELYS